MKIKRLRIYFFIIILLLFSSVFLIWAKNNYKSDNIAKNYLKSDKYISVTQGAYIEFTPKNNMKDVGFIFYPGPNVQEESYAPLCKEIARYGYKTIIVPMPFNLVTLDWDEGTEVIKHHPNIKKWVIGGHSLGGTMASKFVYNKKPESIKGIVFYASYPLKVDFSKSNLKALSIYGSKDSILDKSKLENAKKLLPNKTIHVEIQGGNHCQFGNYGFQKGDSKAHISRAHQQKIAVEYTVRLLKSIK